MTEGRALSRFLTCVTLLRGALNLKQTVANYVTLLADSRLRLVEVHVRRPRLRGLGLDLGFGLHAVCDSDSVVPERLR